ncbi:hypothetical protein DL769_010415 [Monosporascus sp. CRB-8-3]|nr:hypothetical protein DL769_010415 [Monosporascus sp. CRB-8-3]
MKLPLRYLTVPILGAAAMQGAAANRLLGSSFGIPGNNATYDYVVVGGGTAGLVVASRLVEQGAGSVAVVEAGTFYGTSSGNLSEVPAYAANYVAKDTTNWQPLIDWGYITVPQAISRETLGGCSARNYMIYHRGTTGSHQVWVDLVGDDSYTFDQFLPYFEKSVNFTPPNTRLRPANATLEYDLSKLVNKNGPMALTFPNFVYTFSTWAVQALKQIGIPVRKGFQIGGLLGQSYSMFTIDPETMIRDSSETAYLRRSLQNPVYTIYHLTPAKKILFDANKATTGVLVDTMGAQYTLSAQKESLDIPVVADRPGVGQNMQDQIVYGITRRVTSATVSAFHSASVVASQTQLFLTEAAGHADQSGDGRAVPRKAAQHSTRVAFSDRTRDIYANEYPADWPEVEYVALASYLGNGGNPTTADSGDGFNYATLCIIPVAPRSRGRISRSGVAAFKRAREFWNASALRDVVVPSSEEAYPGPNVVTDEQITASIRKSFQTIFHGSCTYAMGNSSDPNAVVDLQARVYGVQNLRVVDAAAFPIPPPGHPQSTVYALAEKIACDISWKC